MKQSCKIINLGKATAIICGSEQTNHKCNEDAVCFDTINNKRFFFKNKEEADKWYQDNFKTVISGSIACSICERAAIDNIIYK